MQEPNYGNLLCVYFNFEIQFFWQLLLSVIEFSVPFDSIANANQTKLMRTQFARQQFQIDSISTIDFFFCLIVIARFQAAIFVAILRNSNFLVNIETYQVVYTTLIDQMVPKKCSKY